MKSFLMATIIVVGACALCSAENQPGPPFNGLLNKVNQGHLSDILRYLVESINSIPRLVVSANCPNVSAERIEEALKPSASCPAHIANSTVCSAIKNYIKPCTAPLITILEECIPKESRGLPSLAVRAIESGAAYLCGLNGEQLIELTNSCIYRTGSIEVTVGGKSCTDLARMENFKRSAPPSALDVCSYFSGNFKECLKGYVQKLCGSETEITTKMLEGLIEAFLTPCKDINKTDGQTEIEA